MMIKKHIVFILLVAIACSNIGRVDARPDAGVFDDTILAYHTYLMDMTPLGVQAVNDGGIMPSGLFIQPGRYKAFGQTYDMTTPGLYRFFSYADLTTIQRIAYSQTDPLPVISGMQWIFTQSYVENSLTNAQLTNIAKYDKLRISCGKAVAYMTWLMPQFGYQARYAGAITQEQWNYVNDGHAMVEIYIDGEWILFDLAFNTRFWRDSEPLSLYEVASDLSTVDVEYMAFDTAYDVSGLWYQGHSLGSLFEPMMDPVLLKDYYARMLDSLIVQDGSKYYYYDAGAYDAQMQGWRYVKIPKEQWLQMMYP